MLQSMGVAKESRHDLTTENQTDDADKPICTRQQGNTDIENRFVDIVGKKIEG